MGSKIIITHYKNATVTCLHDGKKMIGIDVDTGADDVMLGDICIGKVRNIVKNINAAFVEINDKTVCYLNLADAADPFFTKHGNSSAIKVGDEILVQVSSDKVKSKAPSCNTNIELTGKYLVLTREPGKIGVSSKIEDASARRSLKELAAQLVTDRYGFIVRTNAVNAGENRIIEEAAYLASEYERILMLAASRSCFSVLKRSDPEYIRIVRDGYSDVYEQFITDDPVIFETLSEYISTYQPEDVDKLVLYNDESMPLDALYNISRSIIDCYHEKVWLKSGGSIVIQTTEALTAIDVNTEKAIKGRNDTQAMFKKIDLEAADEIAYQLRLRNITGIIIIDFIDLIDGQDRRELLEHLEQAVKPDPVKTAVIDMTKLNLVEMTRKKIRRPLKDQLKDLEN
jgi:ribonuclease G